MVGVMANKTSRRQKTRNQRRAAKQSRMSRPGAQSNYARKRDFLHTVNRRAEKVEGAKPNARVWGFDYTDSEKHWKRGT